MKCSIIDIKTINTSGEGSLSFFESERDVTFEIKRVYYIYGASQGIERGGHAHKMLQQILFCPYGEILIKLEDVNGNKQDVVLDSPSKALVVGEKIWREMVWKKDNSVLCVAASEYYDESDYIRNYDDFKKCVKNN